MMMNNQQIGTGDHGSGTLGSFFLKCPILKDFHCSSLLYLPLKEGQKLRTAVLSDIICSHFESGTNCRLKFPGFEQHDDSIPSWSQASEMGSSAYSNHAPLGVADSSEKNYVTSQSIRDTLQSLVQSSLCSCRNRQSYQENFRDQSSKVPQDSRQCFNISFPEKSPASSKMAKKNRIRWTQELHNQFIECVNRLGGAKKATPKGILKLMNCEGWTIFHIKSHLQKYRVAQSVPESKEERGEKFMQNDTLLNLVHDVRGMQIVEALKMQIDVQRHLYEQLECQKNLQSRIEEQAQQLKKMFEGQVETNTKPSEDAN